MDHLSMIRKQSPLIHNITNYVVMNWTANGLLALGASPVMAHAIEEVADMTKISRALVVNIGTLSTPWVDSMKLAVRTASELRIPIVLDPVGAGATLFRTRTAQELLKLGQFAVIRGNASEISAIAGHDAKSKGVDTGMSSSDAVSVAKFLSEKYHCVVVVSGATDFIVRHAECVKVEGGHEMMSRVTGMGCLASSVIGAFCAVESDYLIAAREAMKTMARAGELAATECHGIGSFAVAFLDALPTSPVTLRVPTSP